MPFQFDVYLMGPSSGVDATHLRAGMVRLFGQLPDEFLHSIGEVPLRIKSGVDLDVAQTFVESIKAAGGVVELVQAGSPAPGSSSAAPPIATAGSYRSAPRVTGPQALVPPESSATAAPPPQQSAPPQQPAPPAPRPQPDDGFIAPAYEPAAATPEHAPELGYDPFGYGAQTNTPDYGMFSADDAAAPLPETNPWDNPGAAPEPSEIPTFAQSGMESDAAELDLEGSDTNDFGNSSRPDALPLEHAPATVPPTQMPMDVLRSSAHDDVAAASSSAYHSDGDDFLGGSDLQLGTPYSADMHELQASPDDDLPLDLEAASAYGPTPDLEGGHHAPPGLQPSGSDPYAYDDDMQPPIDLDTAAPAPGGIPGGATPWQDPALGVAPAAYDPAAPIPAVTAQSVPVVSTLSGDIERNLVALEPVAPTHALRSADNAVTLQPIGSMQEIIGPLHKDLRLGVLGERDLDKMVARYLQQRLQLDEPVRLYVTEPRDAQQDSSDKSVTGVVITDRWVAWRQAKIPLRRLESVAIQSDAFDRSYVEVMAAGETFKLPRLKPFSTLLLAETLGRLSPGRKLWVMPRPAANLRRGMSSLLSKMTKTSLTRGTSGIHSRKAMGHVRHYYNLLQERLRFWESWRLEQRGMGIKMIQMTDIIDIVTAPEFHELRDKLGEETQHIALEMLVSAQKVLDDNEGVIALFELRERTWELPPDARRTPQRTAAYMVLRAGAPSSSAERASEENHLLDTHGVLSQKRLMFLRPGGGVALSIKLGRIEEVKVSSEPMPTITIKYLGAFDERLGLKYKTSGNYLYPVMGTPKQQVERLADRIIDAQERFWEQSQQGLPETTRLPPHPNWLSEAIQREPPERIARMNLVVVELMRDRTTPREVRRLAQVAAGIKLVDLKPMRTRLDEQGVGLGGVGERVLFLPGELFEDPDDGLLVCENALVIAGVGSGRCGWNEIYRFEHINEGRWHSGLIGNRGGDIALRTRDEKFVHFVGLLISSLVYAVNSTG